MASAQPSQERGQNMKRQRLILINQNLPGQQ